MPEARKKRVKKTDIGYGYDSIFPERLRELLSKPNMTQDKLATYCDVARQSVAQWKDGKTMPDIHYLKKIAEYFDKSTDYLLGISEYEDINNRTITAAELGLSEKAIERLKYHKEYLYSEVLSEFISSKWFTHILFNALKLKIIPPSSGIKTENYEEYCKSKDKLAELNDGFAPVLLNHEVASFYKYRASNELSKLFDEVFIKKEAPDNGK